MLLYQILVFVIHGKIQKRHTKIINQKYQIHHGMKKLNYIKDHIMYWIFQIILNISEKTWRKD